MGREDQGRRTRFGSIFRSEKGPQGRVSLTSICSLARRVTYCRLRCAKYKYGIYYHGYLFTRYEYQVAFALRKYLLDGPEVEYAEQIINDLVTSMIGRKPVNYRGLVAYLQQSSALCCKDTLRSVEENPKFWARKAREMLRRYG